MNGSARHQECCGHGLRVVATNSSSDDGHRRENQSSSMRADLSLLLPPGKCKRLVMPETNPLHGANMEISG